MGKTQIIIAGILFFSLAATAFLLTLIEFVNMDKNPDQYKNPRYRKKSTRSTKEAAKKMGSSTAKKTIASKKAPSTKKSVAKKSAPPTTQKTIASKKTPSTKKSIPKK